MHSPWFDPQYFLRYSLSHRTVKTAPGPTWRWDYWAIGPALGARLETKDSCLVPKAGNVVILKLERRGHQPLVNRNENAKTFVGVTINNVEGSV